MSSGQRQGLEGTLAVLRRLTLKSGITPTFCTRWRRQLARQDSQSPSNLSRERLLVGGKRAFSVGDVDAGAKKGAPHGVPFFLVSRYENQTEIFTTKRHERHEEKRSDFV